MVYKLKITQKEILRCGHCYGYINKYCVFEKNKYMRLREEELINIVGFVLCAIITIRLIRTLQTSDTPPPSAVPSVLSAITTCISWKCH